VERTNKEFKAHLDFHSTGGPPYMRSFYLRFHVYAIQKWPFFWNLSSNYQSSLVFLYANSLYASLFLQSLSLAYNKVHLYKIYFIGLATFLMASLTVQTFLLKTISKSRRRIKRLKDILSGKIGTKTYSVQKCLVISMSLRWILIIHHF